MAAKKNNERREQRIAKNNRSLNCALSLFTAGFVAEFYFLLINQYFIKGTVSQVVAASYFLEGVVWFGLVLAVVGLALIFLRKNPTRFVSAGRWLLVLGVFLTLSSQLMLKFYPAGTTAMCILVPVLMLLSVVFLLYQREFAVQALSLTLTIAAVALLNRGATVSTGLMYLLVGVCALVILALCALVFAAQKNGGALRGEQLFPAKADYRLMYGAAVFGLLLIVLSVAVAGASYWALWAGAIPLFALAVWYTVKLL